MSNAIIALRKHEWTDKDIEAIQTVYGEEGQPHSVELDFVEGTEAIILGREDVIALARHFDIVKLI